MMEPIQQTGKIDAVAERGENSSAVSLRKWEGWTVVELALGAHHSRPLLNTYHALGSPYADVIESSQM